MSFKTHILSALLLFILVLEVSAQYVIRRNDTIPVFANGKQLEFPWAGGLNAAHFGEIDLNLDGIMDFVIFEPNQEYNPLTGDRIIPFLKKKSGGTYHYEHAPQYQFMFPHMEEWMILRDFDKDGKADLFTHDYRDRFVIYKNNGTTDGPVFDLFIDVAKATASGYPSSYNFYDEIFWNWEDFPSIEDIDNDGDLDILNIDRGGQFVEYHKNISPSTDTLIFELKNTCWGYFTEDNNLIQLSFCNPNGNVGGPERVTRKKKDPHHNGEAGEKGTKHSNTAILAIDLDGDNVKDLLMGDGRTNSTSLAVLYNGGTVTANQMTSFNMTYPPANPVDLQSYAIPFYLDVDDDGVKDLIVSNRRSGYGKDIETVWFYKNTGTNSTPNFVFQTKSFLQEDMIDVGTYSHPIFFDYNGDSLLDILIGNHGYFKAYDYPRADSSDAQLALFENTGTKYVPEFKQVTLDYAGLSNIKLDLANNQAADGIYPAVGDIDNDGDVDMVIGDFYGNIHLFENTAGPGNPVSFAPPVINYQNIDVGDNAAPQLIDLDRDGKMDLVIGERDGNINYYKNVGSLTNPIFQLEDSTLGEVNVREQWDLWGFSTPFFYEFFEEGSTKGTYQLICGSKSGYLSLYDSIEYNGEITDTFRLLDDKYENIWEGNHSSVNGADFNNDSANDILVGNYAGGIALYTGDPRYIFIPGITEKNEEPTLNIYPNPARDHIRLETKGLPGRRYRATIMNTTGTVMAKSSIDKSGSINVEQLAPGVYFIQLSSLENNNVLISQRFVKL